MGGWLSDFLVAVRHLVPSGVAMEFSHGPGADTDDHRISARDHYRIQKSAMLRTLRRRSSAFWAAHHKQFDPGQQVDVDGW